MTCPICKAASPAPLDKLKPWAKSAQALGCEPTQRKLLSVILRLNEFGFFHAGSVLIGTHAFLAHANQLEARWRSPEQTSDIDSVQAGRNVSFALPTEITTHSQSALTTMEGGILPWVQYRGQAGAPCKHRDEPEFQIDFLTPRTSDSEDPMRIPNLDAALQPMRLMEFSLEDVQQTRLLDPRQAAVCWRTCPHRSAMPCTNC